MFSIIKRRNFWVMVGLDAFLCFAAYYGAYFIRFDVLSGEDLAAFGATVLWIVPLKLVLLFSFKMYRGMWRYTSVHDLLNLLKALSASTGLVVFGVLSFYRFEGFSRGVFVIDFLLSVIFLGGCRLGLRVAAGYMKGKGLGNGADNQQAPLRRLVIIGAGSAGEKLLREVNENRRLTYEVVGFVDDNLSKLKLTIHGVPVLGPLENLKTIVRDFAVDELIIAVPSASATEMRRIVNFCKGSNTPFKTVPGIGELIEGRVSVSAIREVRYEDLLGRQQVDIDVNEVGQFVTGKSVLVTGAAGSIGSELCRQIARFGPSLLCLLDRNESGLYEMEMEFRTNYPGIKVLPVLAAIQNRPLMQKFFDVHRAQVVFHAAAYKHVPMMELYPWEAIFNNVTGTETLLNLCVENKVEKCVIVSTDKAVRPTNVMGACKRLTELLAMAYAKENHCRFMAVRFGNVIGSVGSVVPLFRKQIAQGGPVTVTHKNITRYFMTIPEACRLILQAGAIGRGGEIFVLKMGTPIRIDSLARDMITLSGLKPDEDINIEYIGLRPGEKLFEELITHDESVVPTQHDKITVLSSQKEVSIKTLSDQISDLMQIAYTWDSQAIRNQLSIMVDEYKPYFEELSPEARIVPPIVVGKTARPEDGDGRVNVGRQTARILVVDDEKAVADVISDYLDAFGYSSSTSYSGAEGLKALEQQRYDLVIADLILNDMSGIDFLEEIKKRGEKVGVIIMTGYATIDSGIEAIEKGARDYIAKPLDFQELTKVIDRALGRTRPA
jgi:FlaA1/EpsC-like NDP-sugar epimerase/ActR/RegA family two-component response regulator